MWLFATGQRPSNDQDPLITCMNHFIFVQMVITFMNSVLCRNTCPVLTLSLKQYCISPMQCVLALIRHVVLDAFLYKLSYELSSQADVLKDPCGTEDWSINTVHFTF